MSKYAISYGLFNKEIQIGRLNKAGNMFLEDKEFHTDDAIWSVIQHVMNDFDGAMTLKVGDKTYRLDIKEDTPNEQ